MSERAGRPVARFSLVLFGLAFASALAAGIVLFYGALGSSRDLVWTSVFLSALAIGLVVASVAPRDR